MTDYAPSHSELLAENAVLKKELEAYKDREARAAKLRGGLAILVLRLYTGKDLRASIGRLIEEARTGGRVSSDAIAWTLSALVRRIVRVGVLATLLAVFGGLAANGMLLWQNVLLRDQLELQANSTPLVIDDRAKGVLAGTLRRVEEEWSAWVSAAQLAVTADRGGPFVLLPVAGVAESSFVRRLIASNREHHVHTMDKDGNHITIDASSGAIVGGPYSGSAVPSGTRSLIRWQSVTALNSSFSEMARALEMEIGLTSNSDWSVFQPDLSGNESEAIVLPPPAKKKSGR